MCLSLLLSERFNCSPYEKETLVRSADALEKLIECYDPNRMTSVQTHETILGHIASPSEKLCPLRRSSLKYCCPTLSKDTLPVLRDKE